MLSVFALALLAVTAHAEFVPLSPSPGDSFNQGAICSFSWAGDKTSQAWKVTNVQLMTGNNFEMIHLDTITTVDGTQDGRYEFTCPEVTPNSAIYFYQFSTPELPENKTWATRFTIASATGESVPPENSVQPGTGEKIPWGIGALVDPSKARPAPAYLTGGASSGAPPTSSGAVSLSPSSSPSASVSASHSVPSAPSRAVVSSGSKSASTTAEPTGSAGADNSAASMLVDSRVWQSAVALGVSAMTFTLFL